MKIIIITNHRPSTSKACHSEILYRQLKRAGFNVSEIDSTAVVYPNDNSCARTFINGAGKTEAYIKKIEHFSYGPCYLLKHGKKVGWVETINGVRSKINLEDIL